MNSFVVGRSNEHKITVVITAYNIVNYLSICLDEIIVQTYQDFNVLIVNDCSTDGTEKIAEYYRQRYPAKISIINTPYNLGSPGLARNFALDSGMINGKYSIFLDGDDNVEIDFLWKLYHRAVETEADITVCSYCRINHGTGSKNFIKLKDDIIYTPYKSDQIAFINVACWNKLIRTSLIEKLRFPDLKVGEDAIFFWRLCKDANIIATLSDILFYYHVNPSSIIENISYDSIHAFATATKHLLDKNKAVSEYYELLALCAFIHIGISMAIRVFDNHLINTKTRLSEIRNYLYINQLMLNRKFLTFSSLIKHRIKGVTIWLTKVSYRLNVNHILLYVYDLIRRIFSKDFKF